MNHESNKVDSSTDAITYLKKLCSNGLIESGHGVNESVE